MHASTLNRIETCLRRCGYERNLLQSDYRIGMDTNGFRVPLAGFSHQPFDTRSACVAALTAFDDPEEEVRRVRPLGAPVVFVELGHVFQWWKQGTSKPQLMDQIELPRIEWFFREQEKRFAPHRVYRAKTVGALQGEQMDFVDVGLLPLVESEAGEKLASLITRMIKGMAEGLGTLAKSQDAGQKMFRNAFWLLAAKILRDKGVQSFENIELQDVRGVFEQVGKHYGQQDRIPPLDRRWENALAYPAKSIEEFAHLGNLSTEALAYLYENALVNKNLRKKLAIHSTPPYLIDYIVWHLEPWIRELPVRKIRAFEPACGHAGFLVAVARLLREIRCEMTDTERSKFLRKALRGVDIDDFALEIARLSLTLSDVPNPNGWELDSADIFASNIVSEGASKATILLMNPPYSRFTPKEESKYPGLTYRDKATEAFARALKALPFGGVFGLVAPQGILHTKEAQELRRFLSCECELLEVGLFPDKVFEFSDMETTILLGRRLAVGSKATGGVRYQRVREKDMDAFKRSYATTTTRKIEQTRFSLEPGFRMTVPDLEEVWTACQGLGCLADTADVQRGFSFVPETKLASKTVTIADKPFPGGVKGFTKFRPDLMIHELPSPKYVNLSPEAIDTKRGGTVRDTPQILLDYAPVSRGPWRMKALIDRKGHAVTTNFVTVRPRPASVPLEFLWALCNSPVANAYMYTHTMKRHNLEGELSKIPIPRGGLRDIQTVVGLVKDYLAVATCSSPDLELCSTALLRVDAGVLHLYDLPPRIERKLLDLFAGYRRQGVPFPFERYYPVDFHPCIPLHVYLSAEYARSTAGELRRQWKPVKSAAVLAALGSAADAFSEE